jgi:hypothetical protein
MNYFSSMLIVLAIGMLSLMAGILLNKEPEQSVQSALKDSLAWGIGFLFFFGSEFMLLGAL